MAERSDSAITEVDSSHVIMIFQPAVHGGAQPMKGANSWHNQLPSHRSRRSVRSSSGLLLLSELERALAYPKLRRHIGESDVADLVLIVLASTHRAALVSRDKDLLALEGEIPVFSPRAFLDLLAGA
jgi:predicted nucleic acid-binding protein